MANDRVDFVTPVGRIVQGDCWEPNTTDMDGNPLVVKAGANAGQPRVQYFVGLAIPKTSTLFPALQSAIMGAAASFFPTLFPGGQCTSPEFAFKVMDGDDTRVDTEGKRYCDKEGFAGHWILKLTNGFEIKCWTKGLGSRIENPEQLKRGYFVRAAGDISSNKSSQKPGVFLNVKAIELIGHGDEIGGGDSSHLFSEAAITEIPAGCSDVPLAPVGGFGAPAGFGQAAPQAAAPQAPAGFGQQAPAPAHDFLQAPGAGAQTPQEAKWTLPDGKAYTRAQLSNWTPEQFATLGEPDLPF
jgi:hypothetical protein